MNPVAEPSSSFPGLTGESILPTDPVSWMDPGSKAGVTE